MRLNLSTLRYSCARCVRTWSNNYLTGWNDGFNATHVIGEGPPRCGLNSPSDVLAFIEDQSRQFLECAKHQTDRDNRGAEAVALRATEILDRIAADIRSANA